MGQVQLATSSGDLRRRWKERRRVDGGLAPCAEAGFPCYIAREGSAFCLYFMEHEPRDYHDLAANHNAALDREYRTRLIEQGIFHFPLPLKQGSISFAHTLADIEQTLTATDRVVRRLRKGKPVSARAQG